MGRRIIYSVMSLMGLLMLGSCTQNDGHIGDWFGSWYLEEILINGKVDEEYEAYKQEDNIYYHKEVMISFQGNVFNMAYLQGREIYGTWSYAGEILTLIASYGSGSGYDSQFFNPYPIVLHFPADEEQIEITVTSIGGKTMQWQYIDQNGRLLTYNFRKYP